MKQQATRLKPQTARVCALGVVRVVTWRMEEATTPAEADKESVELVEPSTEDLIG